MTILLKKSTGQSPEPMQGTAVYFGKLAVIHMGEVKLIGPPAEMASQLREWAKVFDTETVEKQMSKQMGVNQMPEELKTPETGWPWLIARFPWLFDGIETSKEPYAHYLKKDQKQQDAQAISHLKNPSQADVAEVLFGDRTMTGGSYRRRILAAIAATTTGSELAYSHHAVKKVA